VCWHVRVKSGSDISTPLALVPARRHPRRNGQPGWIPTPVHLHICHAVLERRAQLRLPVQLAVPAGEFARRGDERRRATGGPRLGSGPVRTRRHDRLPTPQRLVGCGDTKTRKSRRTLALPQRCVNALGDHHQRQNETGLTPAPTGTTTGLCSLPGSGPELDAHNVRRACALLPRAARLRVGCQVDLSSGRVSVWPPSGRDVAVTGCPGLAVSRAGMSRSTPDCRPPGLGTSYVSPGMSTPGGKRTARRQVRGVAVMALSRRGDRRCRLCWPPRVGLCRGFHVAASTPVTCLLRSSRWYTDLARAPGLWRHGSRAATSGFLVVQP
jgi:hypothetical protein